MSVYSNHDAGRNWIVKYKLYHIPIWLLYNYLWWIVQSSNPLQTTTAAFFSPYTVKFSFYVIFQALAVYFNLYFLIPRFLEKGKFAQYVIYLLLTILCAASIIVTGYYLTPFIAGKTFEDLFGGSPNFWRIFIANPLPATLASSTLAMSIKLAKNWIKTQRRQQLLEKEKLETELNYLRYQFNPHFLFNTINSIFFLIHKNPDMASSSLAKFSDLLRYQLYECNDKQIPLGSEITYMENFIELEKLRQNENVETSLQVNRKETEHMAIAPFILVTFVENAFKHVSKHVDGANWIRIKLRADQQQLYFTVSNSTSHHASTDVMHYGGIGLKNVQRRLDLIYQGQYDLDIQSTNNSFEVRLRLDLSESLLLQPIQKTA